MKPFSVRSPLPGQIRSLGVWESEVFCYCDLLLSFNWRQVFSAFFIHHRFCHFLAADLSLLSNRQCNCTFDKPHLCAFLTHVIWRKQDDVVNCLSIYFCDCQSTTQLAVWCKKSSNFSENVSNDKIHIKLYSSKKLYFFLFMGKYSVYNLLLHETNVF